MSREPTIAAGFARALLELIVSKGASRSVLAQRSGIDLNALGDQDNRVPFASYVGLMRAGQALCNEPALALQFGESFDMAGLSIVGLIAEASATFAEAFEQMNRYGRLVVDVDGVSAGERYVLARRTGGIWMVDTRPRPNEFPELTESSFARMVCSARRIRGDDSFIQAVHVTHPAPAYRAEYERIFRVPVMFESDENALLMSDDSWLNLKTARPSRYVFGILSERAQALLESLEQSRSTRGQVETLLLPNLHTGEAGMDLVAGKLGLSRQTLFRRLKGEGVTFKQVLDELRHKLALCYLNDKHASVNETAYLVGFSDPAAFSRAFKRWTGSSPRALRAGIAPDVGTPRRPGGHA